MAAWEVGPEHAWTAASWVEVGPACRGASVAVAAYRMAFRVGVRRVALVLACREASGAAPAEVRPESSAEVAGIVATSCLAAYLAAACLAAACPVEAYHAAYRVAAAPGIAACRVEAGTAAACQVACQAAEGIAAAYLAEAEIAAACPAAERTAASRVPVIVRG